MNERERILRLLAETVTVLRKLGDPSVKYIETIHRRVRAGLVPHGKAKAMMQSLIREELADRLASGLNANGGVAALSSEFRELRRLMNGNRRVR